MNKKRIIVISAIVVAIIAVLVAVNLSVNGWLKSEGIHQFAGRLSVNLSGKCKVYNYTKDCFEGDSDFEILSFSKNGKCNGHISINGFIDTEKLYGTKSSDGTYYVFDCVSYYEYEYHKGAVKRGLNYEVWEYNAGKATDSNTFYNDVLIAEYICKDDVDYQVIYFLKYEDGVPGDLYGAIICNENDTDIDAVAKNVWNENIPGYLKIQQ